MNWKRSFFRAVLGGTVLAGSLALLSVPASADPCGKVREERFELQRAIGRFGYYSPQADHERRDLRNAEARCYGYSGGSSFSFYYGGPAYYPNYGYRDGDDRYFRDNHWFYRDRDNRFYRDDDRRWRGRDRDNRNFRGDRDRDRGRNRDRDNRDRDRR